MPAEVVPQGIYEAVDGVTDGIIRCCSNGCVKCSDRVMDAHCPNALSRLAVLDEWLTVVPESL